MELSRRKVETILETLNTPERLEAFNAIAYGAGRDVWVSGEDAPMDTENVPLRLEGLKFAREIVARCGLGHITRVSDFYFYASKGAAPAEHRHPWLERIAPVAAFRLWRSVFSYDFSELCWRERPWLGSEHDPLLHFLPYSTRVDFERATQAEKEEDDLFERLQTAYDLVCLASDRIARAPIDRANGRVRWPSLEDIQDTLFADSLALLLCDLSSFLEHVRIELVELRPTDDGAEPIFPALAAGSYVGPFDALCAVSGAAQKRRFLAAFEGVRQELADLTDPLREDERVETERDRTRLFSELGVTGDEREPATKTEQAASINTSETTPEHQSRGEE